jgi:hypothetical protein
MFNIMYIRVNRKRLSLNYTDDETSIFNYIKSKLVWPKNRAYLEWEDYNFVEIKTDEELRFVSRLMAEVLFTDTKLWCKDFHSLETKVQNDFDQPSNSDSENSDINSDLDMTMDDYYAMGFNHEIVN